MAYENKALIGKGYYNNYIQAGSCVIGKDSGTGDRYVKYQLPTIGDSETTSIEISKITFASSDGGGFNLISGNPCQVCIILSTEEKLNYSDLTKLYNDTNFSLKGNFTHYGGVWPCCDVEWKISPNTVYYLYIYASSGLCHWNNYQKGSWLSVEAATSSYSKLNFTVSQSSKYYKSSGETEITLTMSGYDSKQLGGFVLKKGNSTITPTSTNPFRFTISNSDAASSSLEYTIYAEHKYDDSYDSAPQKLSFTRNSPPSISTVSCNKRYSYGDSITINISDFNIAATDGDDDQIISYYFNNANKSIQTTINAPDFGESFFGVYIYAYDGLEYSSSYRVDLFDYINFPILTAAYDTKSNEIAFSNIGVNECQVSFNETNWATIDSPTKKLSEFTLPIEKGNSYTLYYRFYNHNPFTGPTIKPDFQIEETFETSPSINNEQEYESNGWSFDIIPINSDITTFIPGDIYEFTITAKYNNTNAWQVKQKSLAKNEITLTVNDKYEYILFTKEAADPEAAEPKVVFTLNRAISIYEEEPLLYCGTEFTEPSGRLIYNDYANYSFSLESLIVLLSNGGEPYVYMQATKGEETVRSNKVEITQTNDYVKPKNDLPLDLKENSIIVLSCGSSEPIEYTLKMDGAIIIKDRATLPALPTRNLDYEATITLPQITADYSGELTLELKQGLFSKIYEYNGRELWKHVAPSYQVKGAAQDSDGSNLYTLSYDGDPGYSDNNTFDHALTIKYYRVVDGVKTAVPKNGNDNYTIDLSGITDTQVNLIIEIESALGTQDVDQSTYTSTITYTLFKEGPTVTFRRHAVGINCEPGDNDVLRVQGFGDRQNITFVNIVIDCGTWD